MIGDSWTHKLARWCVLPLLDTPVTPNHLTVVRLISGLAACAMFAAGERSWEIWGAWVWLFSAFMDRADGELARVGGQCTEWGSRFDRFTDTAIDSLFFLAIGIGLRDGDFGWWAILMGVLASAGVLIGEIWGDLIYEQDAETAERVFPRIAGFDFDDVFYLFAPVVWLGWHPWLLLGGSFGAPAWAIYVWVRLRLSRRAAESDPTP